jgi:DNA-binding MarR family transcriptional regulator
MKEKPTGSPETDPAREMMETFHRFRQVMRKPAHMDGMKSGEMAVMAAVAFHQKETGEGIRVSEIGKMMKIAPPTVTQFISGLEKRGWLIRRMDAQDRRSVQVTLTEEGSRQHDCFVAGMMKMFQALSAHLGSEDTASLNRIMNKALSYVESMSGDFKTAAHGDPFCGPSQEKETETKC